MAPVELDTLPKRLRWARETAGLTTRELASFAEVSTGYPSVIECGQLESPTVASMSKLCRALGVTFDWLMWGAGRRPSEATLRRKSAALKKSKRSAA